MGGACGTYGEKTNTRRILLPWGIRKERGRLIDIGVEGLTV